MGAVGGFTGDASSLRGQKQNTGFSVVRASLKRRIPSHVVKGEQGKKRVLLGWVYPATVCVAMGNEKQVGDRIRLRDWDLEVGLSKSKFASARREQ